VQVGRCEQLTVLLVMRRSSVRFRQAAPPLTSGNAGRHIAEAAMQLAKPRSRVAAGRSLGLDILRWPVRARFWAEVAFIRVFATLRGGRATGDEDAW